MSRGKYERSLKRMQEKNLHGVGALFPLCLARKGNSEAERRVNGQGQERNCSTLTLITRVS